MGLGVIVAVVAAYLAGLATPIIAGALIYRWIADPPRRNRSTHQRRPRHAPHDRTPDPRV